MQGEIIPIEVKSGWGTKSKSLKAFNELYQPPYRVVFGAKNLAVNNEGDLHRYPIYLANMIFTR